VLISLYARENYVDGTVLDQSSITRFIEDNWGLGRIGGGSFDAIAGSVNTMFDFNNKRHDRLFLDTTTGQIAAIQH
jgi:phospholipase C